MAVITITGLSGFIALHIAHRLLQSGHTVRGTVRSSQKGEHVLSLPALEPFAMSGKLSYVVVPDLVTGDYAEAVRGADVVVHAASAMDFSASGWATFRDPAVRGVESVYRAVEAEPSVRQIVQISSFASMSEWLTPLSEQHGIVYNEDTWNPITDDQAERLDELMPDAPSGVQAAVWYCASKKFSELRAMQLAEGSKRGYKLAILNPVTNLGPTLDTKTAPSKQGYSVSELWGHLSDQTDAPLPPDAMVNYVDVRDFAIAVERAIDRGFEGRLGISAGPYEQQILSDRLRVLFPDLTDRLIIGEPGKYITKPVSPNTLDASKANRVLGMTYRSLDETLRDGMLSILEVEKATSRQA